jgi:PST family polysaccharide transporter
VTSGLVARSSKQTAVSQVITQGVRFLTSIVLARLLTPEDFGIVAVALIISAVLDRVKDMGTGMALIQRKHVDQVLLNSVFSFNVLLGALTSILLLWLAVPIANAFNNPASAPAIQVFAGFTFVAALGQIHQSLLRRRMHFRQLAVATATAAVVTAVTSIAGALAGMTFWALVVGTGVGVATNTVLLWIFDRWRPTRHVSLASLRSIARYSWHIFLSDILFLVWNQLDKVIVSRFVGATGLGLYTMSGRLVTSPIASLATVIDDVTFPAFSRKQDDHAALRSGFTRSSGVVAMLIFPLMTGLGLLAAPLVAVVFGEKWAGLVPIIWCLAPAGAVNAVTASSGQLLLAKGRSDWTYRWGLLYLVVLGGLELALAPWGATGVALGYTFGTLLLTPFSLMLAFHFIEMRLRDYLRALWPYVAAVAVMALAMLLATRWVAHAGAHDLVQLAVGFVVGTAVYAGALRLMNPPAVRDAVHALRGRLR